MFLLLLAGVAVRECGAFVMPHQQRHAVLHMSIQEKKEESLPALVPRKRSGILRRTLTVIGTGAAITLAAPLLANAAAEATPHIGEKVATALQGSGVPDAVIIAAIAAMPVVELRGALPVGVWMGVPLSKTLILCVLGNMLPILPLLFGLRAPIVQRVLDKPLTKARKKSAEVLGKNRWQALAAFVGVPFPGTGAWTGAMIAFVIGMPIAEAVSSIFVGVLSAGLIVAALVKAGKLGAVIVAAALAGFLIASRFGPKPSSSTDPVQTA